MSKYSDSFCGQYKDVPCGTLKKLTEEVKAGLRADKIKKELAEIEKHRRIAKEVEELINK